MTLAMRGLGATRAAVATELSSALAVYGGTISYRGYSPRPTAEAQVHDLLSRYSTGAPTQQVDPSEEQAVQVAIAQLNPPWYAETNGAVFNLPNGIVLAGGVGLVALIGCGIYWWRRR